MHGLTHVLHGAWYMVHGVCAFELIVSIQTEGGIRNILVANWLDALCIVVVFA